MPGIFPAEAAEIAWRLAARYWGKSYLTEAANALLDLAFVEKDTKAVVSFAVADNHRSTEAELPVRRI